MHRATGVGVSRMRTLRFNQVLTALDAMDTEYAVVGDDACVSLVDPNGAPLCGMACGVAGGSLRICALTARSFDPSRRFEVLEAAHAASSVCHSPQVTVTTGPRGDLTLAYDLRLRTAAIPTIVVKDVIETFLSSMCNHLALTFDILDCHQEVDAALGSILDDANEESGP